MKPPAKKADPVSSEQVTEKTLVKVYGPYDNPKFGRSVLVITDSGKAYIGEKNCLIENLQAYAVKELTGDEEELGTVVNDISKIVWKPLDTQKNGSGGIDMGATNTILKDILAVAESCQKALTSIGLALKREQKGE